MLDKSGYYHGAAIIRLMEDERCIAVRKKGFLGYIVNDTNFIFLKYTTKNRTPWGFTFDQEDIDRCLKMTSEIGSVFLGLICGGDGVCALSWHEAAMLLNQKPGRIVAARKHNHSYSVWGSEGELKGKIAVGRWPGVVFESGEKTTDNVGDERNIESIPEA